MKEESPENIAAKDAEKVMRRFWRGVKVVNGSSSRLGLKSWSSTGDTVFTSSTEAISEF